MPRSGRPRPRSRSLRMRTDRVMIAIAVFVVLVGGAVAGVAWRNVAAEDLQRQVYAPAAANSASLLSSLVDQETGERGYVITGEPDFLAPYDSGRALVAGLLPQLEQQLRGRQDLLAALGRIEVAYNTWFSATAEPEIADVRAGNQAAAVSAEASGAGKTQFDDLRRAVALLDSRLQARADAQRRRISSEAMFTFVLVLATVAGSLAIALAARAALRAWVITPVTSLAADVRVVAEDDLDHQIEDAGEGEIGSLSRDIESMRRRLRDELEAARQSREALALRSEVTVRLREVLEPSMSGADGPVYARGLLLPAEGVLAGDWFDVIALPSGAVATVVVDISGHGAVAGIFALQVKEHLLGALRLGLDPGAAFAFAAGQVGITEEQFATGAIVCLDPARGTYRWANAGHPAVLRARNGRVTQFGLTGPIVGPLEGAWETQSADCENGDVLVLCTDGIIEARNAEGEELGMAALARIVQQHAGDGPDELAERILSTAREHTAGVMADDATVLVCEVRVPA